MKIVVDQNIPYAREAFGLLGDVVLVPGRSMSPDVVRDADLLVVRSITKVNHVLLDESRVRFVGTCTIGEDHVEKAYLASRGIAFSSAPGCNANSVGDYLVAALLALAERHHLRLGGMRLGIVGVGNVGKRVLEKATALGLECVLNDPPLFDQTGDPRYRPLAELFNCDIITFHTPIDRAGPHPTFHLADSAFLRRMKSGAILINSSRGAVVDGDALKRALEEGHLRGAVLDVWEGEPNVDVELLEMVDIATPHIAGYSFDGKVNGTVQIYQAACRCLGIEPAWDPSPLLPEPDVPELTIYSDEPGAVAQAVRAVYDIMRDDAAMRETLGMPDEARGPHFDRLRKEYPRRREFQNTNVTIQPEDKALERCLRGIGFQVE